jgi:Asp-tRNA(Asn)/Glu-tRNA(Gln) amidotransferase B subunit
MEDAPEAAAQLRAGNEKAGQMLIGAVMRLSGGRAEPTITRSLVERLTGKS